MQSVRAGNLISGGWHKTKLAKALYSCSEAASDSRTLSTSSDSESTFMRRAKSSRERSWQKLRELPPDVAPHSTVLALTLFHPQTNCEEGVNGTPARAPPSQSAQSGDDGDQESDSDDEGDSDDSDALTSTPASTSLKRGSTSMPGRPLCCWNWNQQIRWC